MSTLVMPYEGKDLTIPRRLIEELGVRSGDRVVITAQPALRPRPMEPGRLERIEEVLREASGSWSADDAETFERCRKDMWAAWEHPKLS